MDEIAAVDDAIVESGAQEASELQETHVETEPVQGESYDARKFSPEVNQALKTMRETYRDNPAILKSLNTLRDGYGRYNQGVLGLAPNGVKDIQAWKSAVDSVGGTEKLADMLERINTFEQMQEKLASGDLSVFEAEGLKAAVPQLAQGMLERMAKDSPDHFGEMLNPHFAARLSGTGLGDFIKTMYSIAGDNEPLKQHLSILENWFTRNSQTPDTAALPGKSKDEVSRLREENNNLRTENQRKESERVWSEITKESDKYEEDIIKSAATTYAKTLGLTEERTKKLIGNVQRELTSRTNDKNDPQFMKQLRAYQNSRSPNPDAVKAFIKAKIDSLVPQIVQEEAEYIAPGGAKKVEAVAQKAEPSQQSNGGAIPVRVAEQPSPATLDLKRTTEDMLFRRQGFTKDGKLITWPARQMVN